jgi:hypothetical protein
MSQPTPAANPYGGIFQYLTKINGTDAEVRAAQAKLAQLTPETAAVYKTLDMLPEGELKSWLMANPVQFWKKIIALFKGKTYQTGQYILGERYNDQLLCNGNIGRSQVSDDSVPVARSIFTILFGVRINNSEDLDSLDHGVDAYYARPNKQDIPAEAVQRAVFLKQNFFPISTYNNTCWDLGIFEKYPLVAPIPEMNADATKEEMNVNKLYTGDLPGGARAVNGVIPVDAQTILKQYIGSTIDETTGEIVTPTEQKINDLVKRAKDNPIIIILAVVVIVMIILLIRKFAK